MIIDTLENIALYRGLSTNIATAIDYLLQHNLSDLPAGRFDVLNDAVFVLINEYEPKAAEECATEAHKKYIDIQLMLTGEEKFGFAPLKNQAIVETYNEEKDYAFYDAALDYQYLRQGSFAIFFPTDLHCPAIQTEMPGRVKKAVVKVRV